MEPLSVVESTITAVQAISSIYEAIQNRTDLPIEFKEVNQSLPLAEVILHLAHDQLHGPVLDESSKIVIRPLLRSCEENTKKLYDVFKDIQKRDNNTKGGSLLEFYRTTLLSLGKAHRVETLMQVLLEGLVTLATNSLFKEAMKSQMAKLEESIDQLSKAESAVPDSEFDSSRTTFNQSIASGGTGYQHQYGGHGHHILSGSGEQYNAQTINLVQSDDSRKSRRDILQALCTSLYLDRKNRNPDRVLGTCEWFVGHNLFQQWRESKSSSMLWVSANPGCGKSVLAKYLADLELQSTKSRTTCYFFFKDEFEDQRSAKSAISCILHQLLTQREDFFSDKIVKRLEAYKAYLTGSFDGLWELWDILTTISQDKSNSEIVCILDAFDECEDQERQDLEKALCKFYGLENDTKKNVNLKFLITSRPYDTIRRGFQPLNIPQLPVIHLRGESDAEILSIAREIDIYIIHRVSCIRNSLDLTEDEEQLLLEGLRRIPNQTYLWVYLVLDIVETDLNLNKTRIREVTSSLPQTVDDAYERILAKSRNPNEAKKLLHVIVAAARPLTLAEMDLTLALGPALTSYKDWDRKPEERFGRHIRDLCGLFITIIDSKIYLLHQTAKEFLVAESNSVLQVNHHDRPIWKCSLQTQESHRILCQICIWHLLFTEFETYPLDGNLDQVSNYLRDHIFLDYSATNWAAHFRASGMKDDVAPELLQHICNASSSRCITWFRIYWASTHADFPLGFTTLMIASYFGLEQIVKLQLGLNNVEVDSSDGIYQRSALSWASENGYDNVVELLIKGPKIRLKNAFKLAFLKGVEIDARDRYGRTPLSYAAWNGHLAIVRRLVKKKARVDSMDEIGGTPISYALCTGHQDTANELMKGAQADSVDKIRHELLLSAAEKGHEPIVKRLLETGADTNVAASRGQTPLLLATRNGHEAVVRLLLEKSAGIETKDKDYGVTPLSWAAGNGHEAIVRLLLEKHANIEAKDKNCSRTPLSWAAGNGYEAVVKLLLEKHANIEAKDKNCSRTPLSWAAGNGYEAVVKLLLEKRADIETKDKDHGQTPLSWAAKNGYEAVVRLLLETHADIEAKDKNSSRTPLSWAAENGHEAVVRLLLEKRADIEAKDKDSSRTALSWAAGNGHEAVVRLLLEKRADIEAKDKNNGRTALSWAAGNGHEAVVKLLLEKRANIKTKDKDSSRTPLSWAAGNGHEAVVKLLLEKRADIETKDKDHGQTPLSWAAKNGHEAVVRLLLEKRADIEAKDEDYGRTPLSWADGSGYGAVEHAWMPLLWAAENGRKAKDSDNGRTPLSLAAGNGHEAVVRLLLEKHADTEAKDNNSGRTPLSLAAGNGHEAVVKLLLEKRADIEAKDKDYSRTPLWWAVKNGHEAVVQLLIKEGQHRGQG